MHIFGGWSMIRVQKLLDQIYHKKSYRGDKCGLSKKVQGFDNFLKKLKLSDFLHEDSNRGIISIRFHI